MQTRSIITLFSIVSLSVNLAVSAATGGDVSEKLDQLGNQIESSLENRNPAYINGLVNMELIMDQSIRKPVNRQDKIFREGFEEGFKSSFDLGNALLEEVGHHGSYDYLRAIIHEDKYSLMFRMNNGSSLNFHEITVEDQDGSFIITDIYNFYSDESLHEIIRRMYAIGNILAGNENLNDLEYLVPWIKFTELNEYYAKEKYKKTLKQWSKLPLEIRNEKMNLSVALKAASHLDNEEFKSAFELFMALYPESGGKYLLAIDALANQSASERDMISCTDSLQSYLKGDPYIDLIKAEILAEYGDLGAAAELLKDVIVRMPESQTAYIDLLSVYLAQKSFDEATELLEQIQFVFSSYKDDLHPLLVDYPEFLDSTQYAEWQTR